LHKTDNNVNNVTRVLCLQNIFPITIAVVVVDVSHFEPLQAQCFGDYHCARTAVMPALCTSGNNNLCKAQLQFTSEHQAGNVRSETSYPEPW